MDENTVQEREMNVFSRLIGIFVAPGDTFKAISAKPGWLVAVLVILALTIAFTVIIGPVMDKETAVKQQEMFEKRGMDQAEIDRITEMQSKSGMTAIFKYVGIILWTFVVLSIVSLIWMFVTRFILGGEVSFSQMMALNAFTGIIPAIGMLIKSPIVLSRGTMNVHFSIATFLADSLSKSFIYKFLAQIELFNIWSIAVFCIGLSIIAKKEIKKVIPVVVVMYLIYFLAASGLQMVFGI